MFLQELNDDNTLEFENVNQNSIVSHTCESINQNLPCNQVEGSLVKGLYGIILKLRPLIPQLWSERFCKVR